MLRCGTGQDGSELLHRSRDYYLVAACLRIGEYVEVYVDEDSRIMVENVRATRKTLRRKEFLP